MSDELQARIAELEKLLLGVVEANRIQRVAMDAAIHDLERLRTYLEPSVARVAIQNVLAADNVLQRIADDDSTWRHIAPAYKVDELAEYALGYLRSKR